MKISVRYLLGFFLLLSIWGGIPGFASEPVPIHSFVYSVSDCQRFMTRWLVCGPFLIGSTAFTIQADPQKEFDENDIRIMRHTLRKRGDHPGTLQQMRAFEFDFLQEKAGETGANPTEGMYQPLKGINYPWNFFETGKGNMNFFLMYGNRDYAIAYVYAEIESDQSQKMYLAVGSDDGMKAWLNGELVHEVWEARQVNIDDDIIPIQLQSGKNRLLLKIQNITHDWCFICRLIDPERPREVQEDGQGEGNTSIFTSNSPDRFEQFLDKNPQVIAIIVIIMGGFVLLFFILFLLRKRLGL